MIAPAQYLQQRIDDQITWYDGKSRNAQMRYKNLRVASIAISLSIPILTGMIGGTHDAALKLIISMEAALVALIEGVLSLYKYKDHWTAYRNTSEALKYHRFLFEAGAAPYDVPNAFQVFVQNAEGLMAEERVAWVQTNKAIPDEKPVATDGTATGTKQPDQPQPDATNLSATTDTTDAADTTVTPATDEAQQATTPPTAATGEATPDAGDDADKEDDDDADKAATPGAASSQN